MPELSRAQLLVYGAIAVAVLLVGVRWVRDSDSGPRSSTGVESAPAAPDGELEVEHGSGGFVVHVAGEVRRPGVYRLPEGSRVTDALKRAGGPTPAGSADAINLAAPVADGQQIVVPGRAAAGGGAAATATDGPVSLGTATVEQLDTIEGIGPVTAEDILEFRDEQGGLSSVEELDQISGIGPATMEALRDGLQP